MLHKLQNQVMARVQFIVKMVEAHVKVWTQPAANGQRIGMAMDLAKNKPELIAEHAFLRQPVIILKRQVKQPKIRACELGRMDVKLNRATKTLLIKGFWLENSSTGEDTPFAAVLVRGLIRFTHLHGATQLDAQKVNLATLRAAEPFMDAGITLM